MIDYNDLSEHWCVIALHLDLEIVPVQQVQQIAESESAFPEIVEHEHIIAIVAIESSCVRRFEIGAALKYSVGHARLVGTGFAP